MAALNWCMFRNKGRLSQAGAEIQASVSHCSANFYPISDCYISNFTLKYEDSENIKADCINRVVFNLHQIKREIMLGHQIDLRIWIKLQYQHCTMAP